MKFQEKFQLTPDDPITIIKQLLFSFCDEKNNKFIKIFGLYCKLLTHLHPKFPNISVNFGFNTSMSTMIKL